MISVMNKDDIIKVCDLYAEGLDYLQNVLSKDANAYCKELDAILDAELAHRGGGYEYVHNYAKNYVINKLHDSIDAKNV